MNWRSALRIVLLLAVLVSFVIYAALAWAQLGMPPVEAKQQPTLMPARTPGTGSMAYEELDVSRLKSYDDTELSNALPQNERVALRTLDVAEYNKSMAVYRDEIRSGRLKLLVRKRSYYVDMALVDLIGRINDGKAASEDVVGEILAYIEKHPDSPFLPELYVRMGLLKVNQRPDGKRPDWKEMTAYMQKGVDGMGEGYSSLADTARASLSNVATEPEKKVAYYKWLMTFVNAKDLGKMISRQCGAQQTFNGRGPLWADEDIEGSARMLKVNLPSAVDMAEKNVMQWAGNNRARLEALNTLLKDYPLGKAVEEKLSRVEIKANGTPMQ